MADDTLDLSALRVCRICGKGKRLDQFEPVMRGRYRAHVCRICRQARRRKTNAAREVVEPETKRCVRCGGAKPLSQFHRSNRTADGRKPNCKVCRKTESAARYVENRDHLLAQTAAWAAANPDKRTAAHRARYQVKKDEINAYAARWARDHPESRRQAERRHREAHPEKVQKDNSARRARKLNADGVYAKEDIDRIFGLQRGRCASPDCRCRLRVTGYHVDHIVALSRGGSNWPRNIQLLCPKCNHSKHAKDPIDFARSKGFLL